MNMPHRWHPPTVFAAGTEEWRFVTQADVDAWLDVAKAYAALLNHHKGECKHCAARAS